jgi:hypothetical protein
VQAFRRRVRTQRFWRTCQAFVAALALLTLCGDVWRTAHLILSAHIRCPYDGALVHEDELPASILTAAARDGERAPRPVSAMPRHDHHGCQVSGAIHRFLAIVVPRRTGVRRAVVSAPSLGRDCPKRLVLSILSYAPKLSPPV